MSAGGGVNAIDIAGVIRNLAWLVCQRADNEEFPFDPKIAFWKHLVYSGADRVVAGGVADLATFTVPPNEAWVLFHLAILTEPQADDAAAGGTAGVWYSDQRSTLSLNPYNTTVAIPSVRFLDAAGADIFSPLHSLAAQGQQLLLVFMSGDNVTVQIDPRTVAAQTAYNAQSHLSFIRVPQEVGGRLRDHSTTFIVHAAGY